MTNEDIYQANFKEFVHFPVVMGAFLDINKKPIFECTQNINSSIHTRILNPW